MTYLCGFLNANTLKLLERGSWKTSPGWVPPVVSAVKEYGQVTGHFAPSYIQMCARWLVMLVVMLLVALQVFCTWAPDLLKLIHWISPEICRISWNLPDFTWNPADFMVKSTGFHGFHGEIRRISWIMSFCVMIKYRSFDFRKTKQLWQFINVPHVI